MSQYRSSEESSGPLSGLVVLDISRILSGPYAAMLLGDMGANVIKVERPVVGDDTRSWGPPFVGSTENPESAYFLSANRNKASIALDFKDDFDKEVFWALVDKADVVVENFREGVLERLGMGHDEILRRNPKAIILSITGFGSDGPESGRPGYDQIIQGEAGLMSITGPNPETPTKVGVPISDLLSGIFGALGVVSALVERGNTGRGQVVRTSLLASTVAVHAFQGTRWLVANEVPHATGNSHPTVAPYGAFIAADGVIQIAVGNDNLWSGFAPYVDIDPNDARFKSNGLRVKNRKELESEISAVFKTRTVAELRKAMDALRIPAGVVKTLDEVYSDAQVLAEGLVIDVIHRTLGAISLPGFPVKFNNSRKSHLAPPILGQDTAEILKWLGMEDRTGK